ncbi:MAG: RiPP maturation radical SAM C-methyltransferase [Acidobacteriia bacterium]|nr:RiPP maturation radical SAM C-methyltransferase [Terriglobia bacterium]
MPTLSARFPSIQLALLKPTLERAGIPAQTFSLFMYFGERIGWKVCETIADVWPSMVGEWIWTKAAFGDEVEAHDEQYFKAYEHVFKAICRRAGCRMKRFQKIRDKDAPEFIDFCLEAVDWSRFSVIGFSVVFQQTLASLALAKALKQRYPEIPIVFGGASLEDDIADEIIRHCPQVDYIHCGDAEISFPEMVRRLERGQSMEGLQGVMWRNHDSIEYAGRAPNFMNMDETPLPDFDEYFYARREGGYEDYEDACEPMIPIETARGCWWGERHHCTFCGLNRSGMEFRAKSPEQVVDQLDQLSRKYGVLSFNAIDNIMAPEYTEKLFRRLAEANTDLEIHYEIRPNLSRTQLGRMRKGGLYSVQPGVESLATNVLKSMRKMTTGMRNVELIKWCTYYGISCMYNILMRFPGETEDDYRLQAELVPRIVHLQPPWGIVKARADRGSPMFTAPETQSVKRLRPAVCYDYIYPKRFNLERVSYYFDHDMENVVDEEHYDDLLDLVAQWQAAWTDEGHPTLRYRKAFTGIWIDDGRRRTVQTHSYSGGPAALYEYCADARTRRDITTAMGNELWVQQALDDFVSKGLMLFLDDRYLSLAIPQNPNFELQLGPQAAAIEAGSGQAFVPGSDRVSATTGAEVSD